MWLQLSAVIGLAISAPSEGGKLEQIRARGALIVSVKNQGASAPVAHKDPAHFQKRNFEIEIAERIARKVFGEHASADRPMSSLVDLKVLPKAQRLPALTRGEVDLVISMIAVNEERKKQVDFSEPYYLGGLALMTMHGSKATRLSDLAKKRVGWVAQNANNPRAQIQDAWKARGIEVELVRFEAFKPAADALRDRKIDAMVSWNANIEAFLESSAGEFERVGELLTQERYAIAVRKGDRDLLRLVDETLKEMKSAGELARLAAKHKLAFPKDLD
jgi:aspartate/glutamate/glutamine transport system substrate-binding protein